MTFAKTDLLYENALAADRDVADFRHEGDIAVTFPRGHMRLENKFEPDNEQHQSGAFVLWCPRDFPDRIAVSFDFRPLSNVGLAMVWVAAKGRGGEDLFDAGLAPRNGQYAQYHSGDINALHASFFRRNPKVIDFRTCNLRKSHGFHLVCRGGDPLPDARDARTPYRVEVVKAGPHFRFSINDVMLYHWIDDGETCGPVLGGGKIGFRQMAGLIAEYADLKVHAVEVDA